jgi:ADP-dependent phosphofructokinase/glucokinase
VAGTRARIGTFPTPADLRATLADGPPSAAGLAVIARLADLVGLREGIARFGSNWLVAVPTFALAAPVGTVGHGDSFTPGLLAMLDRDPPHRGVRGGG